MVLSQAGHGLAQKGHKIKGWHVGASKARDKDRWMRASETVATVSILQQMVDQCNMDKYQPVVYSVCSCMACYLRYVLFGGHGPNQVQEET
ncbi:MAG: hypothetical protein HQL55_09375 [Magnetococcales bacterium]|nr:hypothetical protein [Magnetococcales bacterium]